MNSKTRIAGHALHPILVAVPIALFAGTIGLQLAHIGTQDPFYFRAAMIANIAGVIAGLLAAIPGALDLFSIPKHTRARLTGDRHAEFNLFAVGAFAVSAALLFRGWDNRMLVEGGYNLDAHAPLAVSLVGFVSMAIAGLLGYALVHTHRIGEKAPAARRPALRPIRVLHPAH